jgi:hypothetical protein
VDVSITRLIVTAVMIFLFLKIGYKIVGGMARPVPEPPPSGELRRVNLRYQCVTCGAEIRMMKAANEDPMPPRHCMDEMALIPNRFE